MKITKRQPIQSRFDITDLSSQEFHEISSAYINAMYYYPNRELPMEGIDAIYDKFQAMKSTISEHEVTV